MNITTVPYTMELATFAAHLTLSLISSTFLARLPLFILDNTSAMLAGVVQPVYLSSADAVRIMYGDASSERAMIAIDGTRSSLSGAILLNGIAAGDFEFEHVVGNAHPSSAMYPALLAVASAYHKTGEEFLTAMAVGYEIATRIGTASTAEVESVRGFHNPGLNGDLATAAAVGRLMGWDVETIASAMGIAASSSAGLLAFINTGDMTKRLHPARAGQLGAEAAFMAQARVVGPLNILENPDGFLHAFSPNPEPAALTAGLGNNWTGEGMILKLSPTHAYAQVFVYSINSYRSRANQTWEAKDITNVTVYSGPSVLQPSHRIPSPNSLVSAQYSVPFGIAAALTVDLRDPLLFNDALVANQTALTISRSMKFVQITDDPLAVGGYLTMNIRGQFVNISVEIYPGAPGNPGYTGAVEEKYKQVITSLGITAEGAALKAKIESVASLGDISELYGVIMKAGIAARKSFNSSSG